MATQPIRLMRFLPEELAILPSDRQFALERAEPGLLPMMLWQSGLVPLTRLNQIFNWLE